MFYSGPHINKVHKNKTKKHIHTQKPLVIYTCIHSYLDTHTHKQTYTIYTHTYVHIIFTYVQTYK